MHQIAKHSRECVVKVLENFPIQKFIEIQTVATYLKNQKIQAIFPPYCSSNASNQPKIHSLACTWTDSQHNDQLTISDQSKTHDCIWNF